MKYTFQEDSPRSRKMETFCPICVARNMTSQQFCKILQNITIFFAIFCKNLKERKKRARQEEKRHEALDLKE